MSTTTEHDPATGPVPSKLTYNRGCHCQDCRDQAARYERARQWDILNGRNRTVPAVGPQRRLQALVAVGYDFYDMAAWLSQHEGRRVIPEVVRNWAMTRHFLYRRSADRIRVMYEALCMTEPPLETTAQRNKAARSRNRALRNGWPKPNAWFDIDDPNEKPDPGWTPLGRSRDEVDPMVVERLLEGHRVENSTKAEKDEAMRRWTAMGRSERELCARLGWKSARYSKSDDGRAA